MGTWEALLEELVDTRRSALVGYAYVLTGDVSQAEDVVHDAILRTFSKPRSLTAVPQAEAYVRKAIATTFLNGVRGRKRFLDRMHLFAPERTREGPEQQVGDATDIQAALQRLSPRERACVVLRFYEDLTVREIAAALGLAEGSVKRYLSDGLARMTQLLGPVPGMTIDDARDGVPITATADGPTTRGRVS